MTQKIFRHCLVEKCADGLNFLVRAPELQNKFLAVRIDNITKGELDGSAMAELHSELVACCLGAIVSIYEDGTTLDGIISNRIIRESDGMDVAFHIQEIANELKIKTLQTF